MKHPQQRIPCTSWREARKKAADYFFPMLSAGADIHTVWVLVFGTYDDRREWVNACGTVLDVIPAEDT
jgi:hypothetical protein